MEISVTQIAEMLGGTIEGDSDKTVNNIGKIEDAGSQDLCFLANPKYEQFVYSSGAGAIIVSNEFTAKNPIKSTLIRVEDPYSSFTKVLEFYQQMISSQKKGIEQPSFVGENATIGDDIYQAAFSYVGKNAKIGNNVQIYPHAYIGDNVEIGDHTKIYAGVKIYENCKIGAHCVLQAGAVIGSEGFGFAPQKDGTYKPIPQLGNVILEDFVDVGANTTIDCATMGSTIVGKGSKIDNLVQIAHNVEIGENTGVAAQAGISGSTKIGDNCILAGQVGLVGHISIANKTTIGAQSGVSKSVKKEGTFIQGSPAFGYKDNIRSQIVYRKLPELQKQIQELREKILNLRPSD